MKMLYHSLDLSFPAKDPRNKDASIIGAKMDHLNKIVEQILDFARSTEPDLVPVNVNQILEDLGLLTRHKLRNQGVALVRSLDPDLPPVMADATQLEQAFLNLTLNAAEAMPRGGKFTITSHLVKPSGKRPGPVRVALDFTDTGEGMSEEQQKHAFSSLLSTTKAKGNGLGLAIVARVVETHRGELKIKSKPGHGTTISILLPV
jgi:signal transduction histidine kinase